MGSGIGRLHVHVNSCLEVVMVPLKTSIRDGFTYCLLL